MTAGEASVKELPHQLHFDTALRGIVTLAGQEPPDAVRANLYRFRIVTIASFISNRAKAAPTATIATAKWEKFIRRKLPFQETFWFEAFGFWIQVFSLMR